MAKRHVAEHGNRGAWQSLAMQGRSIAEICLARVKKSVAKKSVVGAKRCMVALWHGAAEKCWAK